MQYKCVYATAYGENDCIQMLEMKVKYYLERGWKLQGGVSISSRTVCSADGEYIACQAMVKEN